MSELLPVHLYGTVVGHLERISPAGLRFHTSEQGGERFGVGSPVLSRSLPLAARPSGMEAATNFFGGLLPEGRGLHNLAKQAGAANDDVYALIEFAGLDVAGAVQVGHLENASPGGYAPISDDEILARLDRTNDYAMGSVGGGGSLAGYQPKTTLALINGKWCTTIGGAASTHILKPVPKEYEQSAAREAYSLSLGRRLGLTAFDSHLQRFGDRLVLVIERYDRKIHGDNVERIHQEDAAQALALRWNSDAKFEAVDPRANLRAVAGLLTRTRRALSPEPGDLERLLTFVTFNAVVGNTDAHAKNFSTLHYSNGRIALAPLYDVSSHAMAAGGQQNMALRINGLAYQPDIRLTDLVAEGVSWGLKHEAAEALVDSTLRDLRRAVQAADSEGVDSNIPAYIDRQSANLLDGQRAGAGIGQPPALHRFTGHQV